MAKSNKKFEHTEPQIFDYNTAHLDDLDGHISDYVSYEQEAPQLPAKRQTFVPAPAQHGRNDALGEKGMAVLTSGAAMVGAAMQNTRQTTTHARQDDNAIIVAHAHNIASRPKLAVAGAVVVAIIVIIVALRDLGRPELIALFGIGGLIWGLIALWILHKDRETALYYSAPGVEHHQISAQSEIAQTAIREYSKTQRALLGVKDDD